jgi:acyl-CoA synthetase (NDP forming)
VGASGEAGKNTARPQQFMRRHGWTGTILPINRGRSEIFGEPAYPDLDAAPGHIDHAFVMLPAGQVADALEACGRRRVPVVTIYSDGFAEAGPEGAAAQRALADRARELGVRLLGPNCIGLIDVVGRMPLTVNATLAGDLLPAGRTAVVSQSGSMLGTLLSRGQARGIGFSRLVSVGNEADLGVGEIARMLIDDPHTDVVLLFLETLRDAPVLAQAARAAHARGKAIVAYKLGRSALGAQLAVSHTGAIAGEDAAFDAFFRAHGILRVDLIEALLEIPPLLTGARPMPARGGAPRVAVVSTTGGGAAMVVDRLGGLGLQAAVPPASFVAAMAAEGIALRAAPVIDLTLAATPRKYAAVLRGLLEGDFCDAVLAVAGSSAQFQPALAVEPIVCVAGERAWDKPLAVFLAPQADASLALLASHGIAAFRTPESCADALAARLNWQAPRELAAPVPERAARWLAELVTQPSNAASDARAAGTALNPARPVSGAPAAMPGPNTPHAASTTRAPHPPLTPGRILDEVRSLDFFDALGVPTVARAVLHAAPWTHPLPWPVAAKLVSADLPHKTEAGAVALGIPDKAALAQAVAAMRDSAHACAPAARIDGVLVQPMVRGLAEALLGYRHDVLIGPIVMLGAGGRLAELHRDAAIRVAPVDTATAHSMIDEVKGLAVIRGWRGLPRGDLDALAAAVVAISRLALLPGQPVAEAEVNPLIVGEDGVVAVDGLVVLRAEAG